MREMTAHDLANRLLEMPDFPIRLVYNEREIWNTMYAFDVQDNPSVSASGLVWLGIKYLYGPGPDDKSPPQPQPKHESKH